MEVKTIKDSFHFSHLEEAIHDFTHNGFVVVDLINKGFIFNEKSHLEKELKTLTSIKDITLETYHLYNFDENQHIETRYKLMKFLHKTGFHMKLAMENLPWFKEIIGRDLSIQQFPYLRVAKPNSIKDNIGFHRDTWYGTLACEISVLVPFTRMSKDNTLSLEPGSYKFPDQKYKYEKHVSKEVQKGSVMHQAGIPYMSNILKNRDMCDLHPIPIDVGQILIFNLAVLHGQEINSSDHTRFSMDFRMVNTLENLMKKVNGEQKYYIELVKSPIKQQETAYVENNQ